MYRKIIVICNFLIIILALFIAKNNLWGKIEEIVDKNFIILISLFILLLFKEIYTEISIGKDLITILKSKIYKIMIIIVLFIKDWESILIITAYLLVSLFPFREVSYFEKKIKNPKGKELFPSRNLLYKKLKSYLESKTIKSILIEGEWGEGKTYFVDYFLEKNEEYIPIKIKSSLYKDKIEIRKFIFGELKKILRDNNVFDSAIGEVIDNFDKPEHKFIFNIFNENKTLEKNKDEVKALFKLINDKKILIIIDDLERVYSEKLKLEIISFIADIEEFLEFKLLIIMNYEKVKEHFEYLQKYIDSRIEVSKVPIIELLEAYIEDSEKIKKLESVIKNYNSYRYTFKEKNEKKKEIEERVNNKIKDIYLKLITPRFLNRLIKNLENENIKEFYNRQDENNKQMIIEIFILYFILKENMPNEYIEIKNRENYTEDLYYLGENNNESSDEGRILNFILDEISKGEFSNNLRKLLYDFTKEEKDLYTSEEEYEKYTAGILKEFENISEEKENKYNDIKKKYSVVEDTKKFILPLEYSKFIKNYISYLEKAFEKKWIDSIEYLLLTLDSEIFKSLDNIPNFKIEEEYYISKYSLDRSYYYFRDIDFQVIRNDLWYFTYVFDLKDLYAIKSYDRVYHEETFLFSRNYLQIIAKKFESTKNPLEQLIEEIEIKNNEKDVPVSDFEKYKKYFEIILEINNKILEIKATQEISSRYPIISELEEESDLFNALKEGIYTKSEISENIEELQRKFSNKYLIQCCIAYSKK